MEKAYKHLIRWGLSHKFIIEVVKQDKSTGGKAVISIGSSFREATEAAESAECGLIYFKESDEDRIAGFGFDLAGADADASVNCWNINPTTTEWDKDYIKHCEDYPINNHYSRSNN